MVQLFHFRDAEARLTCYADFLLDTAYSTAAGSAAKRSGGIAMTSPIKRISPDKLPDEARGRDLIVYVRLFDEVQDLFHVAHFIEPVILRLDRGQKGVDVLFQHCQLVECGAVEDHVRILLEGEYPPLFTLADRLPHGYGPLGGGSTGLVVPDDAADEPQT